MKVEYGYARVSSAGQSLERQVQALKEYGIEERHIITDKKSGADFNRQGYLTLKESLLRSGDTLVVKELDRLSRSKSGIKDELQYYKDAGIRVKILNIPTTLMDCDDNNSWIVEMTTNILLEVISSIAESERNTIRKRQREGIDLALAKGVKFGHPVTQKPSNYDSIMRRVELGEINNTQAMNLLGVKKTTFYKYKKLFYREGDCDE